MSGAGKGWDKRKKSIRSELNEALLDKILRTTSLSFEASENCKVAVKFVDDQGIESVKILEIKRC